MRDGWQMVSFYVRPEQHYQLRKLAVEKRTNVSELIREALVEKFGDDMDTERFSLPGVLPRSKKHSHK